MLNIFKDYDLVEEMDRHIKPDEDIFVECRPNKMPFVLRRIMQPTLALIGYGILLVVYIIIRNFCGLAFQNVFDMLFIFLFIGVAAFIGKELYKSILDAKTNYYVIATDGIHILHYNNTLEYYCILYKDIKSVILKQSFFGVGDIYIKETSDIVTKKFFDKVMYKKKGLIGIDEAEKVFEVIRQVSLQENDNIFFADSDETDINTSYFKDVKKYDREIKNKKAESIISKRNQ